MCRLGTKLQIADSKCEKLRLDTLVLRFGLPRYAYNEALAM